MFKPTTLRAYLLRAQSAGIEPERILQGSGIAWAEIEALRPMELETIAALFDLLAHRTPPGFALECGYACRIRDFGLVGFSMMSMPTLREAFECLNHYCPLLGHPLINQITEEGDVWRMHFVPRTILSEGALRFCAEVSVAALEPIIQEMTEMPANTVRVDFPFARPQTPERYALFAGRDLRFDRAPATYYGRRSDLDRPIRSRDGDVSSIVRAQSDKALADLIHTRTIGERLEELMLVAAGHMPTLDEMAAALHMSRRSLQRELALENLTYQDLVKDFRIRRARILLSEQRANIKTVAHELGFKDVSAFRRAFHSWTGQPVGQWLADQARAARPGQLSGAPMPAVMQLA